MKQERNNEMDLLLRRLGRRDDATVSNAAEDHLDADELSAFAENALPAPARARYTAHLAECTRCRELVVQLSASVGVVSAAETAKVSAPSVWRTFLASLFTPMVLRYAAPALGLILVAAIGYVVLRRDQSGDYVTQVTNKEQPPTPTAAGTASPGAAKKTAPGAEGFRDRQERTLQGESDPVPAPAPNSAPVVQTEAAKDVAAAPPKSDPQPQTSANKAAARPFVTPEPSPSTVETEVRKQEVQERPAAAPAAQTVARTEREEDRKSDVGRTANKKAQSKDSARGAGVESLGVLQAGRADENKDQSGETRSVAGRHFRKQGSVWIDTAYDSSRDTMNLTRGSERYRALIADEPEIKQIADQLDGEFIVVWKGRAYRIR